LHAALAEWDIRHNRSVRDEPIDWRERNDIIDERIRQSVQDMCNVIPEGELTILADEGQWGTSRVLRGIPCLPMVERHDQYWGPPQSDESAVTELGRLIGRGAKYLVIAWPAFWWREAYPSLMQHLHAKWECCIDNERITVYRLKDFQ
jgi:hypothetical protein